MQVLRFSWSSLYAHIIEAFVIPVLEASLESFPFVIKVFHSDTVSE
jgi:hypothetical protein